MADLIKQDPDHVENFKSEDDIQLGQWYWISETEEYDNSRTGRKKGETYEWLGCVMAIGSNFVELHSPNENGMRGGGHTSCRVHLDNFYETCQLEDNPDFVIQQNVLRYQREASSLIEEVKALSMQLGLDPKHFLPGASAASSDSDSTALVAISGAEDLGKYQDALVVAKEQTLPELFEKIKKANSEVCRWMLATTMSTQATMIPSKEAIQSVENRIFNVSLYSGLTEEAVCCAEGEPAPLQEKLRVMQRRLYMDEECLANYQAGGMEFKDIREFDAWISEPENMERILPFPRTLVAMRVRRNEKRREISANLYESFVNVELAQSDKLTFLYVRNGEQLHRISCDLEFDEMIFPEKALYDPSEPQMMKMFAGRIDKIISVSDYEARVLEYEEQNAKHSEWVKNNPDTHYFHSPYHSSLGSFSPKDWALFDQSNVYFDDAMSQIEDVVKKYNRIAVIIQGIFDRSQILHPHLPVETWTADGFNKAIELIYDASNVLYADEKPDFEEYRRKCNETLQVGSLTVGQEEAWLVREAERENARIENDWRRRDQSYRYSHLAPPGDPGPGLLAEVVTWQKTKRNASYHWEREKQTGVGTTGATLRVSEKEILNVDAYKLGDYKKFFSDPRTRAEYLKWAPLLLAAEDYHSGKLQLDRLPKTRYAR